MSVIQAAPDETIVLQFSKDWEFRGDGPTTWAMQGRAGTWARIPELWQRGLRVRVICVIGCPYCAAPIAVTPDIHEINVIGRLHPHVKCSGCSQQFEAILDRWKTDMTLYCASVLVDGKLEFRYLHAYSLSEARAKLAKNFDKLVALAPAIGFFVDERADKDGKVLVG